MQKELEEIFRLLDDCRDRDNIRRTLEEEKVLILIHELKKKDNGLLELLTTRNIKASGLAGGENRTGKTVFILSIENKFPSVSYTLINLYLNEYKYPGVNLGASFPEGVATFPHDADLRGTTNLMSAVIGEAEELIHNLIHERLGVDVNAKSNDGNTALILAARNKQDSVIKTLCENGADVNIENDRGMTPLKYSIYYEDIKLAKLLLKFNAKTASLTGPEKQTLKDILSREKHTSKVGKESPGHCDRPSPSDEDALINACITGDLEKVKKLVTAVNADINCQHSKNGHPILAACTHQKIEVALYLLAQDELNIFPGGFKQIEETLNSCVVNATDDTMSPVCIKLFDHFKRESPDYVAIISDLLIQLKRTYKKDRLSGLRDHLLHENALINSSSIMDHLNKEKKVCAIELSPNEPIINIHFSEGVFDQGTATLTLDRKELVVSIEKLVKYINTKCSPSFKGSTRIKLNDLLSAVTPAAMTQAIQIQSDCGEQQQQQTQTGGKEKKDYATLIMKQFVRINDARFSANHKILVDYKSTRTKRKEKTKMLKREWIDIILTSPQFERAFELVTIASKQRLELDGKLESYGKFTLFKMPLLGWDKRCQEPPTGYPEFSYNQKSKGGDTVNPEQLLINITEKVGKFESACGALCSHMK